MKEISKRNIITGSKLEKLIEEALGEIKAMIDINKYQLKNEETWEKICKMNYKSGLSNASYTTIKRLNRQLRWWSLKPGRHSANRIIHFLRTRIFGEFITGPYGDYSRWKSTIPSIKIGTSLKEQTIQKKREEWLKLRNEADKALTAYKNHKGNFYKKKLTIKNPLDVIFENELV